MRFCNLLKVTTRLLSAWKNPAPSHPLFSLDPRMLVIDIMVAHDVYICYTIWLSSYENLKRKRNKKVNKTILVFIEYRFGKYCSRPSSFFFYFVINLAPSSRKFYNRNLPREKVNTLYVKPLHSTICCLHLYFWGKIFDCRI